jgi:formate hydrogenlyase subunit 3/multisubunit Na+/H+ antiporter MnhD subunit
MNEKYNHSTPVEDIKTSIGAFACDLLELVELQGKLLRADAKQAVQKSVGTAAAFAISCCCLIGCLPVAGFGLASAVGYYFELENWISQIVVGGSLSAISIIIAAIAFKNFTRISHQFSQSSEEFSKTLAWTKNAFNRESER